ncbi:MAG TPA: hypothetical protein VN428_02205 [Bryobacteraceae bacterium]|nr:hypothetical protein [Bryobacteraceae bacterium]
MTPTRFGWSAEDVYLVASRAHSLFDQGLTHQAAALFEGLVAVDPANLYCRHALAAVYLSLGVPRLAVDQLSAALAHSPYDAETLARRCEALVAVGEMARAEADLAALRRSGGAGQIARLEARLAVARRGNHTPQLPNHQSDN